MNEHLRIRIEAIHRQLLAVHHGGDAMSNTTRGSEREAFVDLLLRGCLPHPYRFGSGEVTDAYGAISGQIDLVIEHPFFPSFPLLGTTQHRLYLIDGIAIGIEIKSSCFQFQEAVKTMMKFSSLDPDADWPKGTKEFYSLRVLRSSRTSFSGRVRFAIVLYEGWQKPETLRDHCKQDGVEVALQLDPPVFYAARYRVPIDDDTVPTERLITGPEALLAFIFVVNEELQAVADVQSHLFRRYVLQEPPA